MPWVGCLVSSNSVTPLKRQSCSWFWVIEWMNDRMNEWINEWTNEWMNEWLDKLLNWLMNINEYLKSFHSSTSQKVVLSRTHVKRLSWFWVCYWLNGWMNGLIDKWLSSTSTKSSTFHSDTRQKVIMFWTSVKGVPDSDTCQKVIR